MGEQSRHLTSVVNHFPGEPYFRNYSIIDNGQCLISINQTLQHGSPNFVYLVTPLFWIHFFFCLAGGSFMKARVAVSL